MAIIQLKRFGTVLISRPAGLEAFNAIRPTLDPAVPIEIDFDGVLTVTPSWFDEFLTQLAEYTNGKVELLPTTNASVLATLPVLGIAREDAVAEIVRRALARM
ncbi:MAG: hypothetical protein A3C02_04350 [Candidatus Andersenbacteria bacterium RIFCSPHIGHO2_02_FULL_45_11]|uniref:DUF4325 domain-containing protein n=1 Tax=Candidatus Andersenbacteria bacterium RIFCSPHIGHO2_12_FULL_45_11 TaxID=1797281 RepID=A0A1G1X255_9BACT|nr:MAG: hypothetical protein A3C02_04350 [Candidatus Andersenbacteria bacterium RIFCSPHIGHO2_02_FULL_45_11]OGY33447.1 MAG: hypothetical protein A3D99_04880 [Candidatus Andersenbacteria bacterium RIFCSPHIGHO2_12_FULL_45_11]